MRNKLVSGIALGLASLGILAATATDKSATSLTQTEYAELLKAREIGLDPGDLTTLED